MSSRFLRYEEDKTKMEKIVKEFETPKLDQSQPVKTLKQYRDTFKQDLTVKDARFRLSDFVANQLSVEAEDQRRFNEKVEKEVKARLDKLEQAAKMEASKKGFEDGKKIGYQEELDRMREIHSNFEKMTRLLESITLGVFKAHEEALMDFIFETIKTITLAEVRADKAYIQRVLRKIVESSGGTENIKICLSKEDFKLLPELQKGLTQEFTTLKSVTVDVDEKIEPGACRVETNFGEIQASLRRQLENLEVALKGDVRAA